MRILVTGAGGLAGYAISGSLSKAGHDLIPRDHSSLDITDYNQMERTLTQVSPDWVINCAAYTKVDACESNKETAFMINAVSLGILARICDRLGIKVCHISTDYVFDGTKISPYTEEDTPNPISVYGQSKLKGEQKIKEHMGKYLIIRTQWLFGGGGPNFVDNIIRLGRERKKLDVVADQRGCPTYTHDLAEGIRTLIEMDASGIYNVCGTGVATWYEVAKTAIGYVSLDTEIVPVGSEMFPRPAKRPRNSVLSTQKFTEFTSRALPRWQESLKDYVERYVRKNGASAKV